ncbi:MAG: hypothetical protein J6B24_07535 [Clostridia bacterium]|nr:hypothetical protein [Clostridia bacterium]
MEKSYEYNLERWHEGVEMQRTVDYGDPKSVRRFNRGSDVFRKAAKDIGNGYPERVKDFAELMDSEDKHIRLYAAISVAEYMPHTVAQLSVVKAIITEHMMTCWDHEIMGWTWWLKKPWAMPENCVDYDGSGATETPREE